MKTGVRIHFRSDSELFRSECMSKSIVIRSDSVDQNTEFTIKIYLRNQPKIRKATTVFPAKWLLTNARRNSILVTFHQPDLGSAFYWLKQIFGTSWPQPLGIGHYREYFSSGDNAVSSLVLSQCYFRIFLLLRYKI